ncbi:MAG: 5-formyltetrahydrofolate cyclo-ligase [Lautropia sp.]|nr:5-formyltetrahydrofolate cyclo-ligase [Lautropia sp.]
MSIDEQQRARLDALLCQQLQAHDLFGNAVNIAVYFPIRAEPDLSGTFGHWRAAGRRLALPVIDSRTKSLRFQAWDADTELVPGPFGAATPPADAEVLQPDLMLIPCVGFRVVDGKPFRLGYGGGFYDRTLAARPCRTIGIAYDQAETGSFTLNSWDVPLGAVVTPSRCIVAIASPELKR